MSLECHFVVFKNIWNTAVWFSQTCRSDLNPDIRNNFQSSQNTHNLSLETIKMGNLPAKKVLGKKDKKKFRVLMVGLDESGKTTILYRLKMYETYRTEPTVGFNVEEFSDHNSKISMNIWDLGGQKHLRRLWRHYYPGTQVLTRI